MELIIPFGMLAIVLFLIGLAAHFVSSWVYRRSVKAGNKNARTIRMTTFTVSFLVILATVAILITNGFRFER